MKKKIKDFTISEIIEIAKKYKGSCADCPLITILKLPCNDFCDKDKRTQENIEVELEEEIEVD